MKKILLTLAATLCLGVAAQAAPGDTTWVQANNVQLSWNNNYDTTIHFPAAGTSYRKVLMIFTLGKYMCAGYTYGSGSVPWCGDWDYTVQNYLMTPGGDTLEMTRLITPYANNTAPRTPWTWTQNYVYDVTDYARLMHDSATIRIAYSGYSGGFTANIRFAMIEGTPDRDVIAMKRLWYGSFKYGDTTHSDSNNIDVHFPVDTLTAPAGTQSAELKFTVTGHGSDDNQCCEFMSTNYQTLLNGSTILNKPIWRSDCGSNELYPQSGTWLLERANWCPGAMVYPDHTVLPGITAGSTFNTNITFDPYVSTGAWGGYIADGTVFYYGPMNKTNDASLDYIVSPTNDQNFYRENPATDRPVITVKNTGSNTITSMTIQYGLTDSTMSTFNWTGSLAPLHDTDITLPSLAQLDEIAGVSGTYGFTATITAVNGSPDDDNTNNALSSQFISAPSWPNSFVITLAANNEGDASGNSEDSWVIYDMNNDIVAQRTDALISTTYRDTVVLNPGSYKFVLTDAGCDGLQWWAFSGSGITSGFLYVKKLTGTYLNLNGYSYSGTYRDDFGCGVTQYFRINESLAINDLNKESISLQAYPNPANGVVNVDIANDGQVSGQLSILDELGRVLQTTAINSRQTQLDVSGLANGLYTVQFNSGNGNKLTTRIVVAN